MPALPPVAGVIKVASLFTYSGNVSCMNRYFIHYSGTAPTTAQLNTFCTSLDTGWSTNYPAVTSGDVIGTGHQAEDLSSSTGAIGAAGMSSTGTRSGDGLPKATCFGVNFQMARRYRGGKPKIFLPFGTSTDLDGTGRWKGASLSSFGSAWVAYINAALAAGWTGAGTLTHVNVSYYSGFTVVTNPITHRARNVPTLRGTPLQDLITGYSSETDVMSQRRRNQV